MKRYLMTLMLMFLTLPVYSTDLQWGLPGGIGTVQLPSSLSAVLPVAGKDFVLNQYVVGMTAVPLTLFKEIYGYVGGVGVFNSQSLNVQPYLGLGTDVSKYIPGINQIADLHIQGFGRWATDQGKPGAGLSASYQFH